VDITELKRELGKAKVGKRGRYPLALRAAVLEFADEAKRGGKSHRKVAAELGIGEQTLWAWRAARRDAAVVPVAIVEGEGSRELVVECGPLRVHGLDVETLAELLKRLG
jgi:transposase-like protein